MNPELGKKYEKERNAWYAAFNKRTTTEQSPEWNRVPRAEHLLFNLDFVSGGALVTVPNGISRADVLIGLWKYAWPTCWCDDETNIQKALQNRAKIEQDLLKNPRVMEYEGRSIEVDFSKFPELNLAAYVVDHSRGLSAKGIIELIAEETTSPSSAQKKAPAKAPTTPPHPNSGQTSAGQKSNLQKSTERTNK